MQSIDEMARTMYNVAATGTSEFDGTKHASMRNVPCSNAMFDLYQDSRLAQRQAVILKLKIVGAHSIGNDSSLHFNIDGDVLNFTTEDKITDFEEVFAAQYSPGYVGGGTYVAPFYGAATRASVKKYLITERDVERIAHAKKAVVRVDLQSSAIEGRCDPQEKDAENKYKALAHELAGTTGFARFSDLIKTLK